METILQILQWAIPSGGIGAAIAWIANRKTRQAKTAKEVHDTYKMMYDTVSAELVSLQRQTMTNYEKMEELKAENSRTRWALNRLSRAIEAIQVCPYSSNCPVRSELSVDEGTDDTDRDQRKPLRGKGQHKNCGKDCVDARCGG